MGLDHDKAMELEYKALRDELLKRFELRQQVVSVTLAIAGALLGAGLIQRAQQPTYPSVSLIYPPIAALLALGWAQLDNRIRTLGVYIRDRIEKPTPGMGWETFVSQTRPRMGGLPYVLISHGGVFLWTQLMAFAIGWSSTNFSTLDDCLLGFDAIVIIFSAYLLWHHRCHVQSIEKRGLEGARDVGWLP